MSRIWVSVLTLLIYGLAQLGVSFMQMAGLFKNLKGKDLIFTSIYTQVAFFIIAAILIVTIHQFVKNPTRLDQQPKEEKRYVVLWAIVGLVVVMIYQMAANLINIYVFGAPEKSPNTDRLMKVAQEIPFFIILISTVGPILEEYVFRKVIFGELFNMMKGNKVIRFLIAAIVSSAIFSLAHGDPAYFLTYFGMGFILAIFYAYTKRIWVSILIHIMQNSIVVIFQVVIGPDKLKEIQEKASFIYHLIFL
ncbi:MULTISPECIES: intramembrane glutamic endopeptidase MroQ [Staphylococcus]|uniref:Type II CAAX endopeptidase family protein n=1 Tax=Staphylococcus hsinchuensis TaxID=3051183 RepID=A0ABZ3ECY2_9STAP|nr:MULTISPECIES: type II CAAX endopeptidase family protein [unclassified Staphylococcus]